MLKLFRFGPYTLLLLLVAYSIKTYFFAFYTVSSRNMLPNFRKEETIRIDPAAYHWRWPVIDKIIFSRSLPKRGDAVIYYKGNDTEKAYPFLGRIIGLPNDEVRLDNQQVFLNGQPLKRILAPDGDQLLQTVSDEDLSEGLSEIRRNSFKIFKEISDSEYLVLNRYSEPAFFGPVIVPNDHVFILGDNRENSFDSRFTGTVPISHLMGRVNTK